MLENDEHAKEFAQGHAVSHFQSWIDIMEEAIRHEGKQIAIIGFVHQEKQDVEEDERREGDEKDDSRIAGNDFDSLDCAINRSKEIKSINHQERAFLHDVDLDQLPNIPQF